MRNASAIVTGDDPPPPCSTGGGAVVVGVVVGTGRRAARRAVHRRPGRRGAPRRRSRAVVLLVTGASPGAVQSPVTVGVPSPAPKSLPLTSAWQEFSSSDRHHALGDRLVVALHLDAVEALEAQERAPEARSTRPRPCCRSRGSRSGGTVPARRRR